MLVQKRSVILDPPTPSDPGRQFGVRKRRINPAKPNVKRSGAIWRSGVGFGGFRRRIIGNLGCKSEELDYSVYWEALAARFMRWPPISVAWLNRRPFIEGRCEAIHFYAASINSDYKH